MGIPVPIQAFIEHVEIALARVAFMDYAFTVREGHGGVLLQADYDGRENAGGRNG